MRGFYRLEGHEPVACDMAEWVAWEAEQPDARIVARTDIGDIRVSTVFLGLDHRFYALGDGLPILFETMIFEGEHDQWQERCSTWDEAEAMHERACALVRGDAT